MKRGEIPVEIDKCPQAMDLYRRVDKFWGPIWFIEQLNTGPNKYRIQSDSGSFKPEILFSRNHRTLEGLVHELLHLELYRMGYPYFTPSKTSRKTRFIRDVNNGIQHKVMLPWFVRMGFDPDLFESEREGFSADEKKIADMLDRLAPFEGVENYINKLYTVFDNLMIKGHLGFYSKKDRNLIEYSIIRGQQAV